MLISPQFSAASPASEIPGERLAGIVRRIDAAVRRAGRDPGSVLLLAVSKQQPPEAVRSLALAGQRHFGESYAQEALPKIEALADLGLTWHFIGRLQANKTRAVATHFSWVHTVDRERLAERLSAQRPHHAPPLNVCIQVQLVPEDAKGGVPPTEIEALARHILVLPRLRLRGLMCIPPPAADPGTQLARFEALARCRDALATAGIPLDTLSMGMSDDFEAAIAAGATIVRVGTALFGPRHRQAPL